MQSTTAIRSWPAIGLGAFFAAVTARVLFDDVWQGAPITTTHALSLAAIVAALASGHKAMPELRSGRHLTGVALIVLFVAATGYVVVSSGARNAEVAAGKAVTATVNAAEREKTKAALEEAERLHKLAADAMARECASGKGKRCDGQRAVTEMADNHRAVLQARLDRLKPAASANAGYAHAAVVLSALGLGQPVAIERRLELVLPFLVTVIAELGTLTFLSMGLSHGTEHAIAASRAGRTRAAADPAGPDSPAPSTPTKGRRGVREKDAKVTAFVDAYRMKHGADPTLAVMRAAFPRMASSTAQRYRRGNRASGGNVISMKVA